MQTPLQLGKLVIASQQYAITSTSFLLTVKELLRWQVLSLEDCFTA